MHRTESQKLGKEVGAMLLGHNERNHVFQTHYSRGVANLPVVNLVLGKVDSLNDTQKVALV